jgi:hypothetical protein
LRLDFLWTDGGNFWWWRGLHNKLKKLNFSTLSATPRGTLIVSKEISSLGAFCR